MWNCNMAAIRLVGLITMGSVFICTVATVIGLLTTDWFVSDTINVGIASGCSARNVTTEVHIGGQNSTVVTITFCTHFSVSDLQGPLEKIIFGLLVTSILLGLGALFNLLFAMCKRLGGLNFYMLAFNSGLLAAVLVLFAARHDFQAPYDTHVGYSYYVMMVDTALTLVNAFLCTWIDKTQLREYQRLE
eukprot:comp21248_c0_seq1/m.28947 comp21248_c0_seq1/g.28947  ORF comp21248_c0_seq1/g.28947 comp21248_c0_seq1/m.28947 type:complete len:189 (-) comp21248_c0_seq1:814-1380(-)